MVGAGGRCWTRRSPAGTRPFRRRSGAGSEHGGEDFETRADEIVVLDPNTLFVVVHDLGTTKGSGITMDRRIFQIWELRDGLAIRTRHFLEPPSPRSRRAAGVAGCSGDSVGRGVATTAATAKRSRSKRKSCTTKVRPPPGRPYRSLGELSAAGGLAQVYLPKLG